MARDYDQDDPVIIPIPRNYKVPGKWKHFYIRNLCEAALVALFFLWIALQTPFIWQIKALVAIAFGGGGAIFCVVGINEKSTFQFLFDYLKFVYTKRIYHFQNLEEVYGKACNDREEDSEYGESTEGKSNLDIFLEKIKKNKERKKEKKS